jgi:hypothetical protein
VPAAELVLPPLSPVLVGRPYASVPLLAAYTEQRGAGPVRQVNLNQAYVRELFLLAAAEATDGPDGMAVPEADAAEAALLATFPGAVAADPGAAGRRGPRPGRPVVAVRARGAAPGHR